MGAGKGRGVAERAGVDGLVSSSLSTEIGVVRTEEEERAAGGTE